MKIALAKYSKFPFTLIGLGMNVLERHEALRNGERTDEKVISAIEKGLGEGRLVVVEIPDGIKYKILIDSYGLEYVQEITDRVFFAPRIVE